MTVFKLFLVFANLILITSCGEELVEEQKTSTRTGISNQEKNSANEKDTAPDSNAEEESDPFKSDIEAGFKEEAQITVDVPSITPETPEIDNSEFEAPKVSFLSPSKNSILIEDSLNITISTEDIRNYTWEAYYTSNPEFNEGTLIKGNISNTENLIIWDTSNISPGKYYIYVIVKIEKQSTKIVNRFHIVKRPTVTLSLESHSGDQLYLNSISPDNNKIKWIALNTDQYDLNYKLEYSPDNGASYNLLLNSDDLNGVSSFSWDISNTTLYPRNSGYKIKVSAFEDNKLVTSVESNSSFGISDIPLTYINHIYDLFDQTNCDSCHGNTSVNDNKFNMDNFEDSVGAYQLRTKLIDDQILGTNGTMRSLSTGFNDEHFALLKIWVWGGAIKGTPDPAVYISVPQGEELVVVGSQLNISWTLSNDNSSADHYRLQYSDNNGGTWNDIFGATSIAKNNLNFNWDTTGRSQGDQYLIKVLLEDSDNNLISTAQSPNNFGIAGKILTYSEDILPTLVDAGCNGCHGSSGGYDINNYDSLIATGNELLSRLDTNGNMPQGNPESFPSEDLTIVRLWDWGGSINPSTSLIFPVGNQFISNLSNFDISWSILNNNISYSLKIELYDESANSYSIISSNATSPYSWDTNSLSGLFKIRISLMSGSITIDQKESEFFYVGSAQIKYATDLTSGVLITCTGCHGGSGGYTISNFSSLSSSLNLLNRTNPSGGNMSSYLNSPDDWQEIKKWYYGGAAEN